MYFWWYNFKKIIYLQTILSQIDQWNYNSCNSFIYYYHNSYIIDIIYYFPYEKKKKIYRLQEKQLYWKLTLTFHHIYLNLFDSGDHTFKVSSGKFDFVMFSPLWTLTDMTLFPYFEVQISSNTFFSSLFSSEFLQRLLAWFSEYI